MRKRETIEDFYAHYKREYPRVTGQGQFNVYRREEFACDSTSLPPNRRDFYKISLIIEGEGIISSAERSIRVKGNTITFMNPMIPYSWEPMTENQTGYFCLFTEDFISASFRNEGLSQSPLFRVGGDHIFFPDKEGISLLSDVFERMIIEMQSSYLSKYELLRNYVQIIMHEALKMQPPETFYPPANAAQRISTLFMELLERQFPVDSPHQVIRLKHANEFALQLNVHTNHLNRALKDITGRTTSEWIAERVAKEAKALLRYSSWDIAQIGYSLGFEHASNFNTFFKKQTGKTPAQFRRENIAIS